uniref:Immunoglobulin-like beta-sandwich domain-containing protein n=1 Tax=Timema genevievae TaxID=629358 RepID=A0A7R9PJ84_TIMGE|nr:unnamed protein product [Timema genevievae]
MKTDEMAKDFIQLNSTKDNRLQRGATAKQSADQLLALIVPAPMALFAAYVAPVCRPGQQRVHGVARQETARVMCEVDANPSEVHFIWKFNNSAEMVDIQASHFTTDRTRSVASYVPMTELDYGTLLCWGRNELGLQKEPCVFQVIPAGSLRLVLSSLSSALAKPSVEGLKLAKGAQQKPRKVESVSYLSVAQANSPAT